MIPARVELRLSHESLATLRRFTAAVDRLAAAVETRGDLYMSALEDLQLEVQAALTVEESALALIDGLARKLAEAGNDAGAIAALSTAIRAEREKLAASVLANTPSGPSAPTTPSIPAAPVAVEPAPTPPDDEPPPAAA